MQLKVSLSFTLYNVIVSLFPVIGCSELSPPPHAWYKREGNKAVIGCEDNDKEWTVTCTGNRWLGEIGNCTKSGRTSIYVFMMKCISYTCISKGNILKIIN